MIKTIYISGPITDLTTGQPYPVYAGMCLLGDGEFGKENWSGKL